MIQNNILDHSVSPKDFYGGIYQYLKIPHLIKGDVLTVVIDYPLGVPKKVNLIWNENPYDLAAQICDEYRRIYKEEEETSEKKEARICDENSGCTLISRNRTEGKYKIWGHHIVDLSIEGLVIDVKNKTVELYMGS